MILDLLRKSLIPCLFLACLHIAALAQDSLQGSLDFGSKNGSWQIKNGDSTTATGSNASSGSSTATSKAAKTKKEEKWTPVDPNQLRMRSDSLSEPSAPSTQASKAQFSKLSDTLSLVYHSTMKLDEKSVYRISASDNKEGVAIEQQAIQTLNTSKNFEVAAALYRRACTLNPNRSSCWYNMGVLDEQLSLWAQAALDFANASKLNPKNPLPILELGRSLVMIGETEHAIGFLEKLNIKPIHAKQIENGPNGVFVMSSHPNAALYSNIIANASDQELLVGVLNSIDRRQPANAKLFAAELEHRKPFDAQTYMAKGWALFENGRFNDALKAFKESAELSPSNIITNYGIKRCQVELGLTAESKMPKAVYFKAGKQIYALILPDVRNFNSMPIRVYVPDFSRVSEKWPQAPDRDVDCLHAVEQACYEWESASLHKVSFQIFSNLALDAKIETKAPFIVVKFVSDTERIPSHSTAAGLTQTDTRTGTSVITLVVPTKKAWDNKRTFQECTTHEFGHALGLSHSPQPDDIMYYSLHGQEERNITHDDQKRICDLYK